MEQEEEDRAVPIAADGTAADRAKAAATITPVAEAEAIARDEADGETAQDVRDAAKGQGAPGDRTALHVPGAAIVLLEPASAIASRKAEARGAQGGLARPEVLRSEADRVPRPRLRLWSIRRLCLRWVGLKASGWKYGCRIIWPVRR